MTTSLDQSFFALVMHDDGEPYEQLKLRVICNSKKKAMQTVDWICIVRDNMLTGLVWPKTRWYTRDNHDNRMLFIRNTPKEGISERIEFRIKKSIITGDVRKNVTPWFFDDWSNVRYTFELVLGH